MGLKTTNQTDYDYLEISSAIGTLVKTGAGELNALVFNNAGSSWEVDLYDGTSSAATSIGKVRGLTLPGVLKYNLRFRTGLFIDTVKGSTAGDLSVIYE